ncbi:hypothetical protein APED_07510 [Acanthopleuribacter pedis]
MHQFTGITPVNHTFAFLAISSTPFVSLLTKPKQGKHDSSPKMGLFSPFHSVKLFSFPFRFGLWRGLKVGNRRISFGIFFADGWQATRCQPLQGFPVREPQRPRVRPFSMVVPGANILPPFRGRPALPGSARRLFKAWSIDRVVRPASGRAGTNRGLIRRTPKGFAHRKAWSTTDLNGEPEANDLWLRRRRYGFQPWVNGWNNRLPRVPGSSRRAGAEGAGQTTPNRTAGFMDAETTPVCPILLAGLKKRNARGVNAFSVFPSVNPKACAPVARRYKPWADPAHPEGVRTPQGVVHN